MAEIHSLGEPEINRLTTRQLQNGPQIYAEMVGEYSSSNPFIDPEFPHDMTSIGDVMDIFDTANPRKTKDVWLSRGWNKECEWMRIKDIVQSTLSGKYDGDEKITFSCGCINETLSRLDIEQGAIGDCWWVAALSAVACDPELISVVVPEDNADSVDAGIFHFRFWFQGFWVDVVVDDYLPIVWLDDRKEFELVGANIVKNGNEVEIWVPLVEKAFAKLYGDYRQIVGGFSFMAFESLIGGLVEYQELGEKTPKSLFEYIQTNFKNRTFLALGCFKGENGIHGGHAYSITNVAEIETTAGETVQLIRARNPYGRSEWEGDWSDKDSKWDGVSEDDKQRIGFKNQDDGEFWLTFTDMTRIFGLMDVCYRVRHSEVNQAGAKAGYVQYHGEWSNAENNAGGSDLANLHLNPQYGINVDADNLEDCSIIVEIGFKQGIIKIGAPFKFGFKVYKAPADLAQEPPFDNEFFSTLAQDISLENLEKQECLDEVRVFLRGFKVTPGKYVVVPCTETGGSEGKFYCRILYSKRKEE